MIIISDKLDSKDPFIKVIEKILRELDEPFINLGNSIEYLDVDFSCSENLYINNVNIKSCKSSLLWRLPVSKNEIESGDIEELNLYDCISCFSELISNSVYSIIKYPNVINSQNKILQLIKCSELGLKIPKTYYGNNISYLKNRMKFDGKLIFKPMHQNVVGDMEIITPTIVDVDDISDEEIKNFPGFIQSYIDKEYEVRVAVWKDCYIAAKIRGKSGSFGYDWRLWPKDEFDISHYYMPKEIIAKCQLLLIDLGLEFGVFDFIKSVDDLDYYFLELNPAGNFLFCELYCDEINFTDVMISKITTRKDGFNLKLRDFYIE